MLLLPPILNISFSVWVKLKVFLSDFILRETCSVFVQRE
jgi:hypothetical protein